MINNSNDEPFELPLCGSKAGYHETADPDSRLEEDRLFLGRCRRPPTHCSVVTVHVLYYTQFVHTYLFVLFAVVNSPLFYFFIFFLRSVFRWQLKGQITQYLFLPNSRQNWSRTKIENKPPALSKERNPLNHWDIALCFSINLQNRAGSSGLVHVSISIYTHDKYGLLENPLRWP